MGLTHPHAMPGRRRAVSVALAAAVLAAVPVWLAARRGGRASADDTATITAGYRIAGSDGSAQPSGGAAGPGAPGPGAWGPGAPGGGAAGLGAASGPGNGPGPAARNIEPTPQGGGSLEASPPSGPPVSPVASVAATQSDPARRGFVTRVGTGFQLDGWPYRFDGMNIYDVNSNAGQRDWTAMDRTVAAAAAHGERVVAVLANEWAYCDGPQKFLGWWQSGYRTTVSPGEATTYRQWVSDVVSRYADNPAIGIWDLVNEGEGRAFDGICAEAAATAALSAFSNDVGSLVHSIDRQHVVTLGTVSGQCGSNEGDYATIYSSAGSDLCDYHNYGAPTVPMGNSDPYNGLQVSIDRCHADGKPLAVLETGIHYTQLSPPTTANRADLFAQKFAAQFSAGVVGELLWDYSPNPQVRWDYEIGPNDPALGVLSRF